jgi:hypothetical protein
MSSDEVPPPEGVAHAVAAHTSRIAQVSSSTSCVFLARAKFVTDTSFSGVEIPGSPGSSNAIHNVPMDRHRRPIIRLHVTNPPRSRMVYRYVKHFLTPGSDERLIKSPLVCYSLGIYLLNLFLAFLTPKFDPSLEQELADQESEEGTSGGLPTKQDEEFRPFIRRYRPCAVTTNSLKVT